MKGVKGKEVAFRSTYIQCGMKYLAPNSIIFRSHLVISIQYNTILCNAMTSCVLFVSLEMT